MKTQFLKKSLLALSSFVLLVNISIAMPIELGSFSASVNMNNVTLSWTTVQEINNWRFHIERKSVNSTFWVGVGTVLGHGTTNNPQMYSYTDLGVSAGSYNYRLKQEDFNGTTELYTLFNPVIITTSSINKLGENIPEKFALQQNYPNPFNPTTKIKFEIALSESRNSNVKLIIYDAAGKDVGQLVDEPLVAGSYEVDFDGNGFSSGVYFYKLITDEVVVDTKRMILLK